MNNMINSLSKISNYNENTNSSQVYFQNDREDQVNNNQEDEKLKDIYNISNQQGNQKNLPEKQSYVYQQIEVPDDYNIFDEKYKDHDGYIDVYKRTGEVLYGNYGRNFKDQNQNFKQYLNQNVDENFAENKMEKFTQSHTDLNRNVPDYSNIVYDPTPDHRIEPEFYLGTNNSNHLEKQISELQIEINELQRKNTYLQMALAESKKDNGSFKSRNFSEFENCDIDLAKKNENLIEEIKSVLDVNSDTEIIQAIHRMLEIEKTFKLKNQFIEKQWDLYKVLMRDDEENNIDIVKLWRWIKYIVKEMRRLKEGDGHADNLREDHLVYRRFCEKLIHDYNLRDFEELESFIHGLLEKNQTNQKRVEKIKKLLMTEPNTAKFHLSYETPK